MEPGARQAWGRFQVMTGKSKRARSLSRLALAMLACSAIVTPAGAQSLQDALTQTYLNNPTLQAQRAALRATNENVAQALSGWRPTVTVNGSIGQEFSDRQTPQTRIDDQTSQPRSLSMTLSQPVFNGFRTVNQTAAAEAQVKAARARVESTEQQVLLQAVTAYMDVVRDQAVLELSQNNEQVLRRQLEATNDRFRVGEVTRTDVAQAEARLAGAVAARIRAAGALISSRANYQRVVGDMPGTLANPPPLPALPRSEDEALAVALGGNPDLMVAQFAEEAARYDVEVAVGTLLPSVSLDAQHARNRDVGTQDSRAETTSIVARVSVPLYQSGAEYSQIRQRKETASQRRIDIEDIRRQVRQVTIRAWEALTTATAAIEARREQARATSIAFEGVSQEAEVGARTVLDVLDAEQERLDAQVRVVESERDRYVAAFSVLQAMGELTATKLALPVPVFDPTEHYNRVRWQHFGTTPRGE